MEIEKPFLCKQLAKVVKVGMTLEEGISLLAESDEEAHKGITHLNNQIQQGQTFLEVVRKEHIFSEEILQMIELGVETGQLEVIFQELGDYFEREKRMSQTLKSALYYPAILGSMLAIVMCILLIKVLPIFESVFAGMGVMPTGVTKWLFDGGGSVGSILLSLLIFSWVSIGSLYALASCKRTQSVWRKIYQRSKLAEQIEYVRLTGMIRLLLKSGLDIDTALEKGQAIMSVSILKQKMMRCRKRLSETYDLAYALKESALFPAFIRKNIVIGMMSGEIEEAFKEVTKEGEMKLEAYLEKKLSLIEPIAVGGMSLIVGGVLLSIIFPLISLIGGLSA